MKPILFVAVALCCQAQTPQQGLGTPTNIVQTPLSIRQQMDPRYENGRNVFIDPESRTRVVVYGTTGQLERTNEVAWPSAVRVSAAGISVSREGVVAVAGGASKTDGSVCNFILIFDRAGPPARAIETTPLVVHQVALSPDGHVWAMGFDRDAEMRRADYTVFRKYSLDGKLMGQFVSRSTFAGRLVPSVSVGGDSGLTVLHTTHSGVGAYVSTTREWIELDNDGSVVGRWQLKPPYDRTNIRIDSIAFTESGAVYTYPRYGYDFVLCKLDKSAGAWTPVAGTARKFGDRSSPVAFLLGADGDQLVFRGPNWEWLWFNQPK